MCLSLPSLQVAVCRARSSWCCCCCCCAQACLVAIAIACYFSFSNLLIPHTSITTLLLSFSLTLVSNPSHKSGCLFIIQGEVLTNSATLHLQYGAPGLTFTMTEPVSVGSCLIPSTWTNRCKSFGRLDNLPQVWLL
jgi:hypothetical protein